MSTHVPFEYAAAPLPTELTRHYASLGFQSSVTPGALMLRNQREFGRLPAVDGEGRPLFAYGKRIHDQCSRRAHFDAGQFVETFDDEGARKGWCLYEVGCKGPATFSPCPIFMWNDRTSWPIGAGHPCLGCTEPHFWDTMTPFYGRLPDVGGFPVEERADTIGLALAIGAAAGVAAHGAATVFTQIRRRRSTNQVPESTSEEESHNG